MYVWIKPNDNNDEDFYSSVCNQEKISFIFYFFANPHFYPYCVLRDAFFSLLVLLQSCIFLNSFLPSHSIIYIHTSAYLSEACHKREIHWILKRREFPLSLFLPVCTEFIFVSRRNLSIYPLSSLPTFLESWIAKPWDEKKKKSHLTNEKWSQ